VSVAPPGEIGTITRIGRFGYVCAGAASGIRAASAASPTHTSRNISVLLQISCGIVTE